MTVDRTPIARETALRMAFEYHCLAVSAYREAQDGRGTLDPAYTEFGHYYRLRTRLLELADA